MAYQQFGAGNSSFIPSFNWTDDELSGMLQVSYSRDPKSFAINRWAKLFPVTQMVGYYQRLDPSNGMRVVSVDDYLWPLGNDLPVARQDYFEDATFACVRRGESFMLPEQLVKQNPGMDIVAQHVASHCQRLMTVRSLVAMSVVKTSANWGSNYKATGTLAGGGAWSASGATDFFILKSIQTAMQQIQQQTGGVVRGDEVSMVISPTVAMKMRATVEFSDFVKQSPDAAAIQRNDPRVVDPTWGIPRQMYGLREIIVDDTVVNTSLDGTNTQNIQYALDTTAGTASPAFFFTRRGDLVGAAPGRDWSTIGLFAYADLKVKSRYEDLEERVKGVISDNYDIGVVSPQSGYLIGNVLA